MTDQRVRGLLGLCQRAGAIKSGQDMTEQTIKREKAYLALTDKAAGYRSKKSILDACAYANVQHRELPEELLGDAIGKPGRMAACITDAGFARKLLELLSPGEAKEP